MTSQARKRVFDVFFNVPKSLKLHEGKRLFLPNPSFKVTCINITVPTRHSRTNHASKLGIFFEYNSQVRFSQIWPVFILTLHYLTNDVNVLRLSKARYWNLPPLFKTSVSTWHLQKLRNGWWGSVNLIKSYSLYLDLLHLEWWRDAVTAKRKKFAHQLRFRFVNSRFTLLFTNPQTRSDYFFVSSGLFTRYFFFQKAVKRSKTLKLIMTRFARKMLIVLCLTELTLVVRGLAFMLEQLVATLLSPLRHPFKNLLTGQVIDEVNTAGLSLRVGCLAFLHIKPFGFSKVRLKGRIKRKIRRRIHRVSLADY